MSVSPRVVCARTRAPGGERRRLFAHQSPVRPAAPAAQDHQGLHGAGRRPDGHRHRRAAAAGTTQLFWLTRHEIPSSHSQFPLRLHAGGDSIYGEPFADEIHSRIHFNHRGQVAMANAGNKDSNGSQARPQQLCPPPPRAAAARLPGPDPSPPRHSAPLHQFFITFDRCPWIDKKHTIFGKARLPAPQRFTNHAPSPRIPLAPPLSPPAASPAATQVTGNSVYNLMKMSDLPTTEGDRPVDPPSILKTEARADRRTRHPPLPARPIPPAAGPALATVPALPPAARSLHRTRSRFRPALTFHTHPTTRNRLSGTRSRTSSRGTARRPQASSSSTRPTTRRKGRRRRTWRCCRSGTRRRRRRRRCCGRRRRGSSNRCTTRLRTTPGS